MRQRIKNLFFQRKVDRIVKEAVEENKHIHHIMPTARTLNTKKCPRCKQTKLKQDFAKNRTRRDGLQDECRECQKEFQRQRKNKEKVEFIPSTKEFYWWHIITTPRCMLYEINGEKFTIIDVFRYEYLSKQYWKDLVNDKINHMIRWQNKNKAWKKDEDLFYRLKNRCQKQNDINYEKSLFN